MSSDPQGHDRPEPVDVERLHRCLLGQMEPDEFEQLQQELLTSPENRAHYLRAARLDAALNDQASQIRESPAPLDRGWMRGAIAAAAMLLLGLGIWGVAKRQPSDTTTGSIVLEEIATIADSRECRWKSNSVLPVEKRLTAGMIELESGVALIEFDGGAKLALQGPARLELISSKLARLHQGNATVRCEDGAYSFSLQTPTSTVIDLGTEFGVAVESSGVSEVHVLDGEVEVADTSGKEQENTSFLGVGETMIVASNGAPQRVDASTRNWVRDYSTRADRAAKDAAPKVLARDSFPADLNVEKPFARGTGWSGAWRQSTNGSKKGELHFASLEPLTKLDRQDGLSMILGWGEARRSLAQPILPSHAQTVYLGLSLHRMEPTQRDKNGKLSEATFFFRSSKDPSTLLGVALSGFNRWVVREPGGWERSDQPATGNGPYYMVAKFEFNPRLGNKVSVAGYDLDRPIPSEEPEVWNLVSKRQLAKITVPLDVIALQARQTPFKFGEITLGNSWKSVVQPSSVGP